MYLITNGQIVTADGIIQDHELLIENDRIKWIGKKGEIDLTGVEVIDAGGGYISPGFIDLHTDYIENMASPRPNVLIDFNISLKETEKIVINQGITTMFHSLSLYHITGFSPKAIRTLDNVKKFAELIEKAQTSERLIRHRFHARLEIDNVEVVDHLIQYIENQQVHLISFMDHTPGQGQYRDLEIYRQAIIGLNHLTDEQADEFINQHQTKEKLTLEMMKEISQLAQAHGIAIASHDDDSVEKLNLVETFGATISEFPITLDVAKKAKEMGMSTIAGAPNILLGGSHSGNLSAATAISEGAIDILCSDYYPPALLHSIFKMSEDYGQDLGKMFNLVTINPAKAVKMDTEIGSLEVGKKADIIIIEKVEDNFPVVTSTFIDGKRVTRTDYRR